MRIPLLLLAGLVCLPSTLLAQITSYTLQRQKWIVHATTNPVPVAYRFSTLAMAPAGNLTKAEVRTPLVTHVLSPSTLMMYGTNYPGMLFDGTNLIEGLSAFTNGYPLGAYQLYDEYKLLSVPRQQSLLAQLATDFPDPDPIVTNVSPLVPLEATQTFIWPVFATDTNSYTRFYLFEGNLETNMVNTLLTGGIEAITNETVLLSYNLRLPTTQNQITVANLDPALDHLAILEFHHVSPTSGTALPSEASSVSISATFYFALRIVVQPVTQTIPEGEPLLLSTIALGVKPISYQWYFKDSLIPSATNYYYLVPEVTTNHAGPYFAIVTNIAGMETSQVAVVTITNAPPEEGLTLSEPGLNTSGAFQFLVTTEQSTSCTVEASTNLTAWEFLGTLDTPLGAAYFIDTNSIRHPFRYYRAKIP